MSSVYDYVAPLQGCGAKETVIYRALQSLHISCLVHWSHFDVLLTLLSHCFVALTFGSLVASFCTAFSIFVCMGLSSTAVCRERKDHVCSSWLDSLDAGCTICAGKDSWLSQKSFVRAGVGVLLSRWFRWYGVLPILLLKNLVTS